ncbi:MAG: TlpA family protein disulfide reductase [Actinomycetota bacterium]
MNSASALVRKRGGSTIWIVTAAGLIALFAIAIVFTRPSSTTGGAGTEQSETQAVSVKGDSLPPLSDAGRDPAVGMSLPEVSGRSFDGTKVAVSNDGVAKVVVVGAHWCPHCQAEIPRLQEWIDRQGMPEDVELVTLSTAVDPGQPNHPPSQWLEREGWTAPVIADDASGTTSKALGTSGFPFFVFVNADGTVHSRFAGELPIDQFASTVATLSHTTAKLRARSFEDGPKFALGFRRLRSL